MLKNALQKNATTNGGDASRVGAFFNSLWTRERCNVHTLNEGSQTALITRLPVSLCITKTLHPTKKVYNLYTNICFLPVIPLIKESVCFYCHLTLFMRNKLIFNGFKSVG